MRIQRALFCGVVASALSASSRISLPEYCDPVLIPDGEPYAYLPREGRCEGLYQRTSSGVPFQIVGFIEGPALFSSRRDRIIVSWREYPGTHVRMRAISLDPAVPYRMDTRRPIADRTFLWPTRILRGVELDESMVGFFAWRISGRDSVLIPVQTSANSVGITTRVMIYSTSDIKKVWLTLSDPVTGRIVRHPTVARIHISAFERFELEIPSSVPANRYRVEVSAVLDDGRPATARANVQLPVR